MAKPSTTRLPDYRRPANWPLWGGGLLVALALFLALYGATLAPRNPLEQNALLRVGTRFLAPPVAPFTVPGYPLGTDELGRDVFSRLLAGIRPTLVLVVVSALLRLLIGLLIGIGAGWSARWGGKVLDSFIALALALPLFVVALMLVILLKGLWGVGAFIVALCLTGWGDTARLVREQVRILHGSTFMEAARALGSSEQAMIRAHLVPHLSSLLALLLTFEVSSTLMVVAGLGFMGQYVGGDFIQESEQTIKPIFAQAPELGQMLALDLSTIFFGPWRVMASAGMVFLFILGFTLLGDGLRLRLQNNTGRPSQLEQSLRSFDNWFQARFRITMSRLLWITLPIIAMISLAGPSLRSGWRLLRDNAIQATGAPIQIGTTSLTLDRGTFSPSVLSQPAQALWSSDLGNPHGMRSMAAKGPESLETEWSYSLPAPPTSSPIVDHAGNLYLALENGLFLSITSAGDERWRVALHGTPLYSPAIGPDGSLYVVTAEGTLIQLSPDGDIQHEYPRPTDAPPVAGPIIASDGTLYLAQESQIIALKNGVQLWSALISVPAESSRPPHPPLLSAEEELLFWNTVILRRDDGTMVSDPILDLLSPTYLTVGGDGYNYMAAESWALRWAWSEERIRPIEVRQWEPSLLEGLPMADLGITRDGIIWILSATEQFLGARLVLVGDRATAPQLYRAEDARSEIRILGSDGDNTIYLCTKALTPTALCTVLQAATTTPLTKGPFSESFLASDTRGTLLPERLYLIGRRPLAEGLYLAAIGSLKEMTP